MLNVIVSGSCKFRFGGGGGTTVPLLIVAEPVLPGPADASIGAAAASLEGSLVSRPMALAPLTVGCIRKLSPAAGVPEDKLTVNPSTVCGSVVPRFVTALFDKFVIE